MKRVMAYLLAVLLLTSMLPLGCNAAEIQSNTTYYEDGSYLTVEITTYGARAGGVQSGRATFTHTSASGTLNWKIILAGTFTYTGTSATATSSNCTVVINNTDWYLISKTTDVEGPSALATVTLGFKVLGITVSKPVYNLSLTCDANGNLS